ncbi:MAG: phage baseplate protein [Gammaproteobacteria bacterium]|nr:phage baseplate protein [Gammaproteobacteria bacterium]
MRPLDATEVLNVWEHGLNQPTLERALILIAAACPELDSDAVAKLSIGARDARLLQLREWMFGSQLLNTAQCPQCGERVEWEGETTELHIQAVDDADSAEEFNLEVDGYRLRFRLLTSMDIAAVMAAAQSDSNIGSTALIKRCVVSADRTGKACDLADLPQHTLDALSQQIEKLDPQAEIRTELTCPECSHQWEVLLDIASFLWIEINNWAERTLRTVHRLASAYGWTEREILILSPVRRQLYLGMVNR